MRPQLPTNRHSHLTIHRDLKPENVMFKSPLPDNWRESGALQRAAVKIIDLGLARSLRDKRNNYAPHPAAAADADATAASVASDAAAAHTAVHTAAHVAAHAAAHAGGPRGLSMTPEHSVHDGGAFMPELLGTPEQPGHDGGVVCICAPLLLPPCAHPLHPAPRFAFCLHLHQQRVYTLCRWLAARPL